MTKLSTIPQHQLSITCGLCKHHTLLEVANLIAVVGGDTTAHEVRQKGAVRRMRTRIRLQAQPEPMRSIVGATQQEQRFD